MLGDLEAVSVFNLKGREVRAFTHLKDSLAETFAAFSQPYPEDFSSNFQIFIQSHWITILL